MFGLDPDTISNIKEAFSKEPEIEKVLLYGSRAKGDHKNGSDIDITLLGKNLPLETIYKLEEELYQLYLPYTFDISIFTQIDNDDLVEHILSVGKTFYTQNNSQLPKGWEEKKLGDVIRLEYGKPLSKSLRKPDGLFPMYGANGIKGRTDEFYYNKKTIIVGRKGSAGEINLTEEKFWPLDVTYYVTFEEKKYNLIFIFYLLSSLELPKLAKGVKPGINRNDVYDINALFPPLPEQKRIVTILDKAFAAIAKAKANAEQNLKNAKELFDSSLSKAVIGEITKKWREENSPEKANGCLELKQIILQIKGTERKKSRGEGTIGHELITNLLPKKWGVTNVESLFDLVDYRGKNPPRSTKGFRLITAKNIKMGYLSDEPITFISEETYKKWMIRGFPKLGDIFFVTEGHTMGFVALNNRSDNFALAQRTITLQPAVPFDTKFFFYFMLSPYFQKIVKLNATGAAAVGMKGSRFRSLPLPFPSIAEQQAIVQKLDALSAETKKLEAIYQQKKDDLDELKKTVLQKAFNGELTEKEIAL